MDQNIKTSSLMSPTTLEQVKVASRLPTENLKLLGLQVKVRLALAAGKPEKITPNQVRYLLDLARQENEMRGTAPIGENVKIVGTVEKVFVNKYNQKGIVIACATDEGTYRLMGARCPTALEHLEEGERIEFSCETKPSRDGDPSTVYFSKPKGLRTVSYVQMTG